LKKQFKSGEVSGESLKENGHLYKKAILCRTGVWNGDVKVDEALLNLIVKYNNKAYSSVINENSYPPVQIEHNTDAKETLGRIDIGKMPLALEPASNYNKGWEGQVLVAMLRIFDEDAKKNVGTGKFNHLSVQFDDETGELYEVSFVAVEAARGSQLLKHKEKKEGKMKKKQLSLARKKVKALAVRQNSLVKNKVALSIALGLTLQKVSKSKTALSKKNAEIRLTLKKENVKSVFSSLVREGKVTKAEFDKMDFEVFAGLETKAFGLVLNGYSSREVSSDMFQIGDTTADSKNVELSDAQYKQALEAQLEGKEFEIQTVSLKSKLSDEEIAAKKKLAEEGGEGSEGLSTDEPMDITKIMEMLEKMQEQIDSLSGLEEEVEAMKKLSEEGETKELSEDEEVKELMDDEEGEE